MNPRLAKIREAEKNYHEACYDNYRLFEAGSWLAKPVKTVMDTLKEFQNRPVLNILDLGCGVGRNSIPMAQALKGRTGQVVCVDLLDRALQKLEGYSREFGVKEYITTEHSDIGDYAIEEKGFDYIIAVSALEHVESEVKLIQVLDRMARGTREGGINCLIMSTQVEEVDKVTGEALDPYYELNLTTGYTRELLLSSYAGWDIRYTTVRSLQYEIERDGRAIYLKGDCLTYVFRKPEVNKSIPS
ncbi:class I SAM-dependent methyltransferase [Paenibacillus aurantius]|uniref:Class I SAM-dependent methyltransferase n=1 Tax=Paenibacillus aurantius TaxID=2918900 RepID=A0AA96RIA0_9BACL|nr:class I SAM-dependent methyltransferase [Paenibacillus aurantius]WNQ11969.1 class I SAM-dependent methyltransferase [Paenibacillus aurantius]